MRKLRIGLCFTLLLMGTLRSGTAFGRFIEVGPVGSWCTTINGASPGDEIVLTPDLYTTPCRISVRGTPSNWITIRSGGETSSHRATFAYSGSTANVLELHNAAYIILRGFSFAPTVEGVDALRFLQANDVVIERNLFTGIGGISISANAGNTQRITVRQNTFKDLQSTGMYFGNQDGTCCSATEVLIEGNLIDGVTTPDPSIGYGLQIKLNSYGTVRDNTIYRTKGPGMMFYGSSRGDPPSIAEGNYVEGSRNEAGVVIGGGPAIVRNNVLIGNAYGGVSAQDYGRRGLQKNVWIVHNTILHNESSGINVQGWNPGAHNIIAYNAILPLSGTPALHPSSPAGTMMGNVTCTANLCFVNAFTPPYDLWPSSTGPLLDTAGNGIEPWRPIDDFIGVARGSAADVGAFERTALAMSHLIGGGAPRPLRISAHTIPPAAPTHPHVQ